MQLKCEVCDFRPKSYRSLSAHLREVHKIKSKEYYDSYLSTPDDGKCKICSNQTKFDTLVHGYRDFCGPKCARVVTLARLKSDPEKFEKFREKVKAAVKIEWETKDQSKRIANMTETLKQIRSNMTEDELKELYNPIKNMTDSQIIDHFKRCIDNGAGKWWKEATENEKQVLIDRRSDSIRLAWEERGSEIMKKQLSTFLKNNTTYDLNYDLKQIDKSLSKFFGIERTYG